MTKPLTFLLAGWCCLLLAARQQGGAEVSKTSSPKAFSTGEHFEYRVHYGFINAAEASVDIHERLQTMNGRPCYKVMVSAQTTGAFDLVTRVRESWQSYIDTATLLPQYFFMRQEEGRYLREQRVNFNYTNDQLTVRNIERDHDYVRQFPLPASVHDVVSGYFQIRTLDLANARPGQSYTVRTYYVNNFYDLKIVYRGQEVIRTKYGRLNTHKLSPQLPNNDTFEGKDAIRIWVSDDENRLPVKIEFDLAVGSVALDLKQYKGMKHAFRWKN